MESVALSSKGQFVLPKAIRDRHQWQAGTRLLVIDRGNEVILKSAEPFAATNFESASSPSVFSGPPLSLADMDRAVATMDLKTSAKSTALADGYNIVTI